MRELIVAIAVLSAGLVAYYLLLIGVFAVRYRTEFWQLWRQQEVGPSHPVMRFVAVVSALFIVSMTQKQIPIDARSAEGDDDV